MTTYELDEPGGGELTLPSGHWRWFVIRVNSMPENRCASQQLIFANESYSDSDDVMRVDVPRNVDSLDDEDVRRYARNPDTRSFLISTSEFTIWPPTDDMNNRMWRVRPASGYQFRTSKHIEKPLGELTNQELAEIVTSGI
jgi:hypothetical protein